MNSLYPDYAFKLFNENQIEPGFFNDIDMIVFPGGVGDSDSYDRFFKDKTKLKVVTDYVKNGGRYLGICMGAYWADKDYFNILHDCRALQYIKQPNTDTRRPHPKAIDVNWSGINTKMYFYDGCALVGDQTKFTTIARYRNGDPMAIIQGRIGLIGCHPESDIFWYNKPYLLRHWHGGAHHALLRDFVDHLMTL